MIGNWKLWAMVAMYLLAGCGIGCFFDHPWSGLAVSVVSLLAVAAFVLFKTMRVQ